MTTELRNKLFAKCLKIYERKRSLLPVHRYLNRLNLEGSLQGDFWCDYFKPEIRKRYFPNMTLDSLLEESFALYRSSRYPSSALIKIWGKIDWEIPFINEEYYEFVEQIENMLKNEPNPPSKADWDELDEFLRK